MKYKVYTILIILTFILMPISYSYADIIYFRDGKMSVGKVASQGFQSIVFESNGESRTILKREIRRIEYGDPVAQTQKLKQREILELRLKKQRAEAIRLAEEQRLREETMLRLEQERKAAEEKARSIADANARDEYLKQIAKLNEEIRLSNQETARIRMEIAEIEKENQKIIEKTEIIDRSLTYRAGKFYHNSAALRTASKLGWTSGAIRFLNDGPVNYYVPDAGSAGLDPGHYHEVEYTTHYQHQAKAVRHRFVYADTRSTPYRTVEQSISTTDNASASVHYTSLSQRIVSLERPRLTEFEYGYFHDFFPFSKKGAELENFRIIIGGSLFADYVRSARSLSQTTRRIIAGTDPGSSAPDFAIVPVSYSQVEMKYAEGVVNGNLGIGYSYNFANIHAIDLSASATYGYGGGNYNRKEKYYTNTYIGSTAFPLIKDKKDYGAVNLQSTGFRVVTGYSINLWNVRLRLFAMMREFRTRVTKANIKSNENNATVSDMVYRWSRNSQSISTADLTLLVLQSQKDMGPLPKSDDVLRGAGIELTVLF